MKNVCFRLIAARLLTAGILKNWLHVELTVLLLTTSFWNSCYAVQAFTLHGANIVWAESDTTEGEKTMAFPGLQVPMPMTYFTHPSICAVL